MYVIVTKCKISIIIAVMPYANSVIYYVVQKHSIIMIIIKWMSKYNSML